MTNLNSRLLAAHAAGDKAQLVTLYTQAANEAPDTNTACFFLTHAYIFALELGHSATAELYTRLKDHGRV